MYNIQIEKNNKGEKEGMSKKGIRPLNLQLKETRKKDRGD